MEHTWIVGTEDPTKYRRASVTIKFDVVVAPGVRLTDLPDDLLTAKLLAYWALSPSEGWASSGSGVTLFVRNYLHLVRWRLHHGVKRNSQLSKERVDSFFRQLEEGGVKRLVPLEARLTEYAQNVRSGLTRLPTYEKGNRTYLSRNTVMYAIGVSDSSIAPRRVLDQLDELAIEFGVIPTADSHRKGSGQPYSDEEHRVSAARLHAFLKPLSELYRLRHRLAHDPIGFDPFASRSSFDTALALGKQREGRTFSVPPLQACSLAEHSLRWVLDYSRDLKRLVELIHSEMEKSPARESYSPHRIAIERVVDCFEPEFGSVTPGSPWPIWGAYHAFGRRPAKELGLERPAIRTVLFDYLMSACMVVIATFSARRKEEIESLKASCIHIDDENEPWLETYIEKTVRDLDKVPVPYVVARAVEVLEWLSETRRERVGSAWLFEFDEAIECQPPGSKEKMRFGAAFDAYRALDRFSEYVGIPPLEDGTRWIPKPHQFRRFFGIIYYNYYRYAHLSALSNFYRHFDPDMTRRYVTEAARGAFLQRQEDQRAQRSLQKRGDSFDEKRLVDFESAALEYRLERYKNIALEKEYCTGFGGELITSEIRQLVEHAKLEMDLRPEDDLPEMRLDTLITEFARGRRLEPNRLGHSNCKCGASTQDLRAAECIKADGSGNAVLSDQSTKLLFSSPLPENASDRLCSRCPHNVQFPEHRSYWEQVRDSELRQSECAFGPLLKALALERHAMANEHLARCHSQAS